MILFGKVVINNKKWKLTNSLRNGKANLMYPNFSGLNPKNKPEVTLFQNNYGYNQMLVEKNISVYSS